jgi:hypothetical protein
MTQGSALKSSDLFEKDVFSEAIKGGEQFLKVIKDTRTEMNNSLAAQKQFVSAFKVNTFNDVKNLNIQLKETAQLIKMKQALEIAEQKVLQQQEILVANKIRSSILDNKLTQEKVKLSKEQLKADQALTSAIEKEEKARRKNEQSLRSVNGEYKKGVQALAAVKQQLKELEFTGRTSGKVYKALSLEFKELDARVRGAETSVGEFQRNVGNYASGWNGLGNSINQLSREMPAFANSINTGFMAISNNLPQLFDEINKIKKANVELAKSGQPTTSAFKQVLSGIFSWQTALSVGVTLLTIYGGKMITFIGNLFSANEAFSDGTAAIDENTKAIERNKEALTDLQNQVDEIIKGELKLEGTLNDMDLARANAFDEYEKNLDNITKLRKQAADEQIKAAAESISDEEDRVEFLSKLQTQEIAGVYSVAFKKGITRRDFSEQEINLVQATNSRLLGMRNQYDLAEAKAGELLNERLVDAKQKFDKEAEEAAKKAREKAAKEKKDLYSDEARIIAQTAKLKADAIEDEYLRNVAALEAENLNMIKEIQSAKATTKSKHDDLLALEMDFYRKKAALQIAMIAELQNELDKYQDEATAEVEKDLKDRLVEEAKIRHDAQLVRIYQSEKDDKELLAAKIAAIEEERDILLTNAHLTEDEVYIIKHEAQKKIDELNKEATDKRVKEALTETDKLVAATDKWLKLKYQKQQDSLKQEIDENQKAIDTQQRLAERGFANTLAFEEAKAAKLELERKKQQEKEIKQQKIISFYNLFSSYAKTDPSTALQKATFDTILAELIAGSFYVGTEKVSDDLSGNKFSSGRDGYIIRADGDERIFTGEDNKRIGDISNHEAANILEAYDKGILFNYGNVQAESTNSQTSDKYAMIMLSKLDSIAEEIRNKPVISNDFSNFPDIITTTVKGKVKEIINQKNRF